MWRTLQTATPLILLAMAGFIWFEKLLPGASVLREWLGEDGVLRFCLGVLCLYVLVLVVERQRMEGQFTRVLKTFKEFHQERLGDGVQRQEAQEAQGEAVRLLVAALGSEDPEVRTSSAAHLKRLTGQDLGEDQDAWNRWLASAGASPGEGEGQKA